MNISIPVPDQQYTIPFGQCTTETVPNSEIPTSDDARPDPQVPTDSYREVRHSQYSVPLVAKERQLVSSYAGLTEVQTKLTDTG